MKVSVFPLDLVKSTDELKELIAEHPSYPIVVLADEEAVVSDWHYTLCSDITFAVGEILNCENPIDEESVCTDRDEFEERFEEWLWDRMFDELGEEAEPNEEEFQDRLKLELAKFEPYWTKVIMIYASN